MSIHAHEILLRREILNQIERTLPAGRETECDYIMDAQEAMEYGMIDCVVRRRDL